MALLADAEAGEDAVEDVVGVDAAGDAAQFVQGEADFGGDEFFAGAALDDLARPAERIDRGAERIVTPLRRWPPPRRPDVPDASTASRSRRRNRSMPSPVTLLVAIAARGRSPGSAASTLVSTTSRSPGDAAGQLRPLRLGHRPRGVQTEDRHPGAARFARGGLLGLAANVGAGPGHVRLDAGRVDQLTRGRRPGRSRR